MPPPCPPPRLSGLFCDGGTRHGGRRQPLKLARKRRRRSCDARKFELAIRHRERQSEKRMPVRAGNRLAMPSLPGAVARNAKIQRLLQSGQTGYDATFGREQRGVEIEAIAIRLGIEDERQDRKSVG